LPASSGLTVVLALTTLFVASTEVSAHRTDDCLQAARIGLEPDRVTIALDLTPGTAMADSFIAALDLDRDGSLSAAEQRTYAEQVVRALTVAIDARPLQLRLLSASFPELAAFGRGEGAIRLQIEAPLANVSAGPHQLLFRNVHLAGHSAYLANALVPGSTRVAVTGQGRAHDQSELTIEYTIRDSTGGRVAWGLGGLVAAAVLMVRFRSSGASN
jgi:hypothetical protein